MNMQAADMLETVRTCVNDLGLKNAAVRDVLAEAEKHGWIRLVCSMNNQRRVKLIRLLAEDNQATHAVLKTVVGIYERIIEQLVAVAEQELDSMAIQMDDAQNRKATSWLELLVAGGVGYAIGKTP
jgi:DNA-binding MarR family transcriptional regulator